MCVAVFPPCYLPRAKLWSSELNSPIPVHFSSLIPRMLMFILARSCLTTSNLPWFTNLTFQVPMQYYSLQHGTYFHHQSHPQLGIVFSFPPSCHRFCSYFSTLLQEHSGHHYLHYPLPEFGLRSSHREGTQHPSTENWIKDLLSMALPIRTRSSFPHSQSLPSGSFHKPFILIHQREDRMKITITVN